MSQYQGAYDHWFSSQFSPILERLTITAIAWEKVVSDIARMDSSYGGQLARFYEKCKQFNAPANAGV